jgi:hypothetical protein
MYFLAQEKVGERVFDARVFTSWKIHLEEGEALSSIKIVNGDVRKCDGIKGNWTIHIESNKHGVS